MMSFFEIGMIKSRKHSKYYRWILRSKNHKQAFTDWLIDNGFDVYDKSMFIRGEVLAFNGFGGRGSLFETGYANTKCIDAITKYLKDSK